MLCSLLQVHLLVSSVLCLCDICVILCIVECLVCQSSYALTIMNQVPSFQMHVCFYVTHCFDVVSLPNDFCFLTCAPVTSSVDFEF